MLKAALTLLKARLTHCRDLEQDAKVDDDIFKLLDGADGDPATVEARIDEYLASDGYNPNDQVGPCLGVEEPVRVVFRSFDPGSIYVRSCNLTERI